MTDKIVTAEEMRHYDSYTINTIGIPSPCVNGTGCLSRSR